MNLMDCYPSRYLKAADVPPDGLRVSLVDILVEEMTTTENGRKETVAKPVAYFATLAKGLVLNKTNSRTLTDAFGPDIEDLKGHEVDLVVRDVDAFGKVGPAIRISIPKVKTLRGAKPAPAVAPQADTGD